MWQKDFLTLGGETFTVVGIALDAEGIAPANRYYEEHGVTFPALVDANYATRLDAVPKTYFVDEHGVVQPLEDWRRRLKTAGQFKPVTDAIRAQWSEPGRRTRSESIARLVERLKADPSDLATAVEATSRYLELGLADQARDVLATAVANRSPKQVARSGDRAAARLLSQAYFQLSRASAGDRDEQVRCATLSFYLRPSVGYGKQIARIIAPEKFDNRPGGDFDNEFREGTLARLRRERQDWLSAD